MKRFFPETRPLGSGKEDPVKQRKMFHDPVTTPTPTTDTTLYVTENITLLSYNKPYEIILQYLIV